jgi:glycosyltransferase involved in cell wall biosynthesis
MVFSMIQPLLTILIDTHNQERFIEQAILSVLEQDFPRSEMEILVVDDGSTDCTPEIVRKFEPELRLLRKANGGQASAFNAGIPEARGEIIAFLDGDDWWAKEKLRVVTDYFAAHPHVGIVGHGIYEFDSTTGKVTSTLPERAREIGFDDASGATFFRQMMCFFGTSRVAIRRNVLDRILPIPESLVVEADEFMSIMSVAFSRAGLIQKPLTFYRLHDDNLFQIRTSDEVKTRRIQRVLAALAEQLRIRLHSASVAPEVIQPIVEPLDVGSKRLRLMLDGGMPWETFRAERAEFRLAYRKGSPAYWMFKGLVLACTLVLPPRSFYRLRNWYSGSRWRRWRGVLGEPSPRAEISKLAVPQKPRRQEAVGASSEFSNGRTESGRP